jgi:hypothetical protein
MINFEMYMEQLLHFLSSWQMKETNINSSNKTLLILFQQGLAWTLWFWCAESPKFVCSSLIVVGHQGED